MLHQEALAISERTYALVAMRAKRGPAQTSTTMVSRLNQVTNKKRHICLNAASQFGDGRQKAQAVLPR